MKKLTVIVIVFLIIFTFTGCNKIVEEKACNDSRWIKICYTDNIGILVDKDTNVCYLYQSVYNGIGITVMLDADGKPVLYKGE